MSSMKDALQVGVALDCGVEGGASTQPEPANNGMSSIMLRAKEMLLQGKTEPLTTLEGRAMLFIEMFKSNHPFFNRVFRGSLGNNGSLASLHKKNPTEYRRIMYRTLDLIKMYCVDMGMYVGTFKDYMLSFDNGQTVRMYGAGVPMLCEILRKKNNLPPIKLLEWNLIVDTEILHQKPNTGDIPILKRNLHGDLSEFSSDVLFFSPRKLDQIFGISGIYSSGDTKHDVTYIVPKQTRGGRNAFSEHPVALLRRKLRNACYKDAFQDLGCELEVEDEDVLDIVSANGTSSNSSDVFGEFGG